MLSYEKINREFEKLEHKDKEPELDKGFCLVEYIFNTGLVCNKIIDMISESDIQTAEDLIGMMDGYEDDPRGGVKRLADIHTVQNNLRSTRSTVIPDTVDMF